eukprot:gene11159-biopygen18376
MKSLCGVLGCWCVRGWVCLGSLACNSNRRSRWWWWRSVVVAVGCGWRASAELRLRRTPGRSKRRARTQQSCTPHPRTPPRASAHSTERVRNAFHERVRNVSGTHSKWNGAPLCPVPSLCTPSLCSVLLRPVLPCPVPSHCYVSFFPFPGMFISLSNHAPFCSPVSCCVLSAHRLCCCRPPHRPDGTQSLLTCVVHRATVQGIQCRAYSAGHTVQGIQCRE